MSEKYIDRFTNTEDVDFSTEVQLSIELNEKISDVNVNIESILNKIVILENRIKTLEGLI